MNSHTTLVCVPISVFYNNEDELGDFESVITLIDAYDSLEADSLNDFEYFVDAYLCLTGLNADAERYCGYES